MQEKLPKPEIILYWFCFMLNLAVKHCYNKKWNTNTANFSFLFLDISGKINYLLYLWLKIIKRMSLSLWKKDVQQVHVKYKNSQLSINISTGHSFAVVTLFSHNFSTVTLGRLSWELFQCMGFYLENENGAVRVHEIMSLRLHEGSRLLCWEVSHPVHLSESL